VPQCLVVPQSDSNAMLAQKTVLWKGNQYFSTATSNKELSVLENRIARTAVERAVQILTTNQQVLSTCSIFAQQLLSTWYEALCLKCTEHATLSMHRVVSA
jgi:hypothetical protein